jgi:hypothetical protein
LPSRYAITRYNAILARYNAVLARYFSLILSQGSIHVSSKDFFLGRYFRNFTENLLLLRLPSSHFFYWTRFTGIYITSKVALAFLVYYWHHFSYVLCVCRIIYMCIIFTLYGRKLYSHRKCKGKYIITCVGNIFISVFW